MISRNLSIGLRVSRVSHHVLILSALLVHHVACTCISKEQKLCRNFYDPCPPATTAAAPLLVRLAVEIRVAPHVMNVKNVKKKT